MRGIQQCEVFFFRSDELNASASLPESYSNLSIFDPRTSAGVGGNNTLM